MELLSEYRIIKNLSSNSNSLLYRAERHADKAKVLLRIFRPQIANREQIDRIWRSYNWAEQNNLRVVNKLLDVQQYNDQHVLIFENVDGITLEEYLKTYKYNLEHTLKISINIADILGQLFELGIVHQNICPSILIVDTKTLQVALHDLSIISTAKDIKSRVEHPAFLKGPAEYVSPEQTGRIKAAVDIRSDLYSIGVILYELLTGMVPFSSEDAITIVHQHIAKGVIPPHVHNANVPPVLSSIVVKLLSKNAFDRYQAPFGLKNDLLTCYNQLLGNGTVDSFELGIRDFSGALKKDNGFYGRAREIAKIQQVLERTRLGQFKIAVIEGPSGIGKSTLVHLAIQKFPSHKSIFLEGKFDQFQSNVPYFSFIQSLVQLVDYILLQPADIVSLWKDSIRQGIGLNGKVLTDIIPHLESLIGTQPELPELEINEKSNRLNYVFINFIKSISKNGYQIIFFFDDLQWADSASLSLLKEIASDKDIGHVAFLGAFRYNNPSSQNPLTSIYKELQSAGCRIEQVLLDALPYADVEQIVLDLLGCPIKEKDSFVTLIYNKSNGNPFFINAFMKCLFNEKILTFNFSSFIWEWENSKVDELKYTDDIIDLLSGKIQKLPVLTQEVLKLAACLGYKFDTNLISVLLDIDQTAVVQRLKPAIDEMLVFSAAENFHFTHDRIQQASYLLISIPNKAAFHLWIGKKLLNDLNEDGVERYMFEIVNQLNSGLEAINLSSDKIRLVELNLAVGLKAGKSAAYKLSFDYLQAGINILQANNNINEYGLTLKIFTEGAEAAFLTGNLLNMEAWIFFVLGYATDLLDKVRVYEIRIKSYTAQHKLTEAVKTSLQVLSLLGIRFPDKPTNKHILIALAGIRLSLMYKSFDDLLNLPLLKDKYAEAAIRILISVGAPVYFTNPKLLPLFSCKAFSLMVKYGNSSYSGVVCASYGLIRIAGLGDINGANELGAVALKLSERFGISSYRCQSVMMVNNFILHWKTHIKKILGPLHDNYFRCLETGNIEFASYSATLYCFNSFVAGKNLVTLSKEALDFIDSISQLRQQIALNLQKILAQAILNLKLIKEDPSTLSGQVHDEKAMLSLYKESKAESLIFDVYLYKLILAYLFGEHDIANTSAAEARIRLESVPASSRITIFYFYDSLNKISLLTQPGRTGNKHIRNELRNNLKKFKEIARQAPENCLHRLTLIEAELFKISGVTEKAYIYFDRAIEQATKNEYPNDLALICELAGKFYLSQKRELNAKTYLAQSYKLYLQWGAFNKANDLLLRYGHLFQERALEASKSNELLESKLLPASTKIINPSYQQFDLHTIIKASILISSEIELNRLIKNLVKISVENIGAQTGYLILRHDNIYSIQAKYSISAGMNEDFQPVELNNNKWISENIIHFVTTTNDFVLIENAKTHPHFSSDPMLLATGVQSILCAPILNHGDLIGLLYFENGLITNAFTSEHIEILRLLSGQMAVSLENALLQEKKMQALVERESLLKKINSHEKELLKTKLEIQEQTFQHISQEIHDNIGQLLSLVKVNLNSLNLILPVPVNDKLQESQVLLTQVIQDLRDLSKSLNTDFVNKIGLEKAIRLQLGFLQRAGTCKTQLVIEGKSYSLDAQYELVIFRIIQELLNNILKHSGASLVCVKIIYNENLFKIEVVDNGRGFDFVNVQSSGHGLGLKNVANRISLLNGSINFVTKDSEGTKVEMVIPI